jgi:hypothetical protein
MEIDIEPIKFTPATRQPQYPSLPPQLLAAADAATNGELFWPGHCAADVARALAAQGRLITGVEVYARRAIGWAAYLGAWTTSLPHRERDWCSQVEDALEGALHAIAQGPGAWGEPDASLDELRFFFASTTAALGPEEPPNGEP